MQKSTSTLNVKILVNPLSILNVIFFYIKSNIFTLRTPKRRKSTLSVKIYPLCKHVYIKDSFYIKGCDRGQLQFHTFRRRFVYRWYLTMQGMNTWPKVSNYRRRSQKLYSINCGQDGHVYKTNIGTFIHSYYILPWWCVFLKHKIQCWPICLLHRLNDNTFWVYRQCT